MNLTRRIIFVATCLLTTAVHAAAPAQLVTPDLHTRDVTLQSLRESAVSFFDADRAYRREPLSNFLQLRFTDAQAKPAATGVLMLVDGQRFRGRWLGGADEGQAIRWQHELFGEMVVDLEYVAGWQSGGEDGRLAQGADDVVALVNGDRLHGFVVAVSGEGVSIQIQLEGGPQSLQLGIQQVRRVDLANPVRQTPGTGRVAYLVDGTQAQVAELTIEDERVTLRRRADDEPLNIPLSTLMRVDFPSDAVSLRDLSALPMTLTGGGDVFAMSLAPRTDGTDVLLHAPMTVMFDLPEGAQRFAAKAVLDVDPHDPAAWASFELVIRSGDRELARYLMSAEQPAVVINLPVSETLTLELNAGANGPVMDRLRLRDAVVLLKW